MDAKSSLALIDIWQSALQTLELNLSEQVRQKIFAYIDLLLKWNKAYNLTASKNPHDILIKHVLDSISIYPYIKGPNILDVGSGAGFPGIPLALIFPDWHFYLLDSNHKKTTFLSHVALSLPIKNITIITQRVEEFQFATGFATIVTRATTSLKEYYTSVKHLCGRDGQMLAMKGKFPEIELREIAAKTESYKIHVPGLDAERHLIIMHTINR